MYLNSGIKIISLQLREKHSKQSVKNVFKMIPFYLLYIVKYGIDTNL